MSSRHPPTKELRVAAVWGTQVLAVRHLRAGEALRMGDPPGGLVAIPEGAQVPNEPLRAVGSSWELDARGTSGGTVRLRGRDEDPAQLGDGPIPLVVGDYGLLQYGSFGLFFQFTQPVRLTAQRPRIDYGLLAAFAVACFAVGGALSALKEITPKSPFPKPVELTSRAELSRRLRLPPVTPTGEPGADGGDEKKNEKKDESGGHKPPASAGGKVGKRGPSPTPKIQGSRPDLGGMSEVLAGSVGQEVQETLGSISSVAAALGGLRSDRLVLGEGSGSGLLGTGRAGDGSSGAGYGAGALETGSGTGSGGPSGAGRGLGSGSGNGLGTGERKMSAAQAPTPGQGLGRDAIDRVVKSRYGAFRACYDSAATQSPKLSGTVSVSFRVAKEGNVQSASISGSTLANPRVEGCVLRQFKRMRFPAADKGTNANYPFVFKPKKP